MKTFEKDFEELFDLSPLQEELNTTEIDYSCVSDTSNSIFIETTESSLDSDSEFARKNIRELIVKGHRAIDSILYIATQSEHPRAFEVAANFIKNISDLNKDLLEIQKRKSELLSPKDSRHSSSGDIYANQAVFVGSTKELLNLIKDNQTKTIENGN
jgi:hypothetical protein